MIARRALLQSLAVTGAAMWLSGHAPYRQWTVYRSNHLVILSGKWDSGSEPLAQTVVDLLGRVVPESRPRLGRAPTLRHTASLLLTRQIEVAVVAEDDSRQIAHGSGASQSVGAVPLRLLAFLKEPYVLLASAEFDREQGELVVSALFNAEAPAQVRRAMASLAAAEQAAEVLGIPLHPALRAFLGDQESALR